MYWSLYSEFVSTGSDDFRFAWQYTDHGNQRALSEFDEIAEENGVIAVWPQGFDNSLEFRALLQFGRRTTTERYWTDSGDSQQGRDESLCG